MMFERLEKRIKNSVLVAIASIVIGCCTSLTVFANEQIQVKVITQVEYSKDNKEESLKQLIHKFKQTAIKKVMNSVPQAKLKVMQKYIEELTSPELVDRFVTRVSIPSTNCEVVTGANCGTVKGNSLEIKGIAFVNMTAIDLFLEEQSSSLSNSGIGEFFSFLFIARKVTSKTEYDEKTTKIFKRDSVEENEVITGQDDTSTSQGNIESELESFKDGGSTMNKLDKYDYAIDLAATASLSSSIYEKMADSGFLAIDAKDYFEKYDIPVLNKLVEEGYFSEDGTLDDEIMTKIKDATKSEGDIKFFGVGKIDYGLPEPNELTGKMRIPASVEVQVFMVVKTRMAVVASVSPQLVYGEYEQGGDRNVGEIRAQTEAVSLAMDTIVSQLQSKRLR